MYSDPAIGIVTFGKETGGHPGGEDHHHHDISGLDPEKLANALKGALA